MQDSAIRILKERGFWTDRFKYVYRKDPSYIAAEHSAQQSRVRLREYTEAFKLPEPGINVLQCSTTMEMGVDIGDIDIVLLDGYSCLYHRAEEVQKERRYSLHQCC